MARYTYQTADGQSGEVSADNILDAVHLAIQTSKSKEFIVKLERHCTCKEFFTQFEAKFIVPSVVTCRECRAVFGA